MNINAAQNRGSHPSCVHKSIYCAQRMLAPYCGQTKGDEALYGFIAQIYKEMYLAPEKWLVPVSPYEIYLNTMRPSDDPHFRDPKECNLRNAYQQAIMFSHAFLLALGRCGRYEDGALVLSRKEYDALLRGFYKSHIGKDVDARIALICKRGIDIIPQGDKIHFVYNEEKTFFESLIALATESGAVGRMNALRLNMRHGNATLSDVLDTLEEKDRITLETFADKVGGKLKIKPLNAIVSTAEWKGEWRDKNGLTAGFYASPSQIDLIVYMHSHDDISRVGTALYLWDKDMFQFYADCFPKRECRCKYNRAVMLGEERRRICGLSCRAQKSGARESDVSKMEKIIALRDQV